MSKPPNNSHLRQIKTENSKVFISEEKITVKENALDKFINLFKSKKEL